MTSAGQFGTPSGNRQFGSSGDRSCCSGDMLKAFSQCGCAAGSPDRLPATRRQIQRTPVGDSALWRGRRMSSPREFLALDRLPLRLISGKPAG